MGPPSEERAENKDKDWAGSEITCWTVLSGKASERYEAEGVREQRELSMGHFTTAFITTHNTICRILTKWYCTRALVEVSQDNVYDNCQKSMNCRRFYKVSHFVMKGTRHDVRFGLMNISG